MKNYRFFYFALAFCISVGINEIKAETIISPIEIDNTIKAEVGNIPPEGIEIISDIDIEESITHSIKQNIATSSSLISFLIGSVDIERDSMNIIELASFSSKKADIQGEVIGESCIPIDSIHYGILEGGIINCSSILIDIEDPKPTTHIS